MTTTITEVSTEGLDLRPALELRPRAEAIRARLIDGDHTAIADARELCGEANAITDRFMEALQAHAWGDILDPFTDDHVWPLVDALSIGDIGGMADDLANPPDAVTTDRLPANAVGIAEFDGWVELLEWRDDGKARVRFPNTGAEMLIVSTMLRSVVPGPGLVEGAAS